jgi:hypothetical protein
MKPKQKKKKTKILKIIINEIPNFKHGIQDIYGQRKKKGMNEKIS